MAEASQIDSIKNEKWFIIDSKFTLDPNTNVILLEQMHDISKCNCLIQFYPGGSNIYMRETYSDLNWQKISRIYQLNMQSVYTTIHHNEIINLLEAYFIKINQ